MMKSRIAAALAFPALLAALLLVTGHFTGASPARAARRQVALAGTAWELGGTIKGSIKRVGKLTDEASFQLFFGPLELLDEENNPIRTLTDGQLLINDLVSGALIDGTFVDEGKGKAVISLDNQDVAGYLEDRFELAFGAIELQIDTLTIESVKTTAKAKAAKNEGDADTIKLKATAKFFATGSAQGIPGEGKGKYTIKASGVALAVTPG